MTRRFEVLTTSGRDCQRWAELFQRFPVEVRDVHYNPDYARIYELTYSSRVFSATLETDGGCVLLPFEVEDMGDLAFVADPELRHLLDAKSLYGYGGPLVAAATPEKSKKLCELLYEHFSEYCETSGIVSEFASLHPLLANHVPLYGNNMAVPEYRKRVVYIDLSRSEEQLVQDLSQGHRSNISKARRLGVAIERNVVEGTPIDTFYALYQQTLGRNKATPFWYFPKSYVENCAKCLGRDRVSLFEARMGDNVMASFFIIHASQIAYYHFAGSDERFFSIRSNNLLLHEIALWAKREGFRYFHLGSGLSENDGVYRFKAGFSPCTADYYVYKRVIKKKEYEELCDLRKEAQWTKQDQRSDYFPEYRR